MLVAGKSGSSATTFPRSSSSPCPSYTSYDVPEAAAYPRDQRDPSDRREVPLASGTVHDGFYRPVRSELMERAAVNGAYEGWHFLERDDAAPASASAPAPAPADYGGNVDGNLDGNLDDVLDDESVLAELCEALDAEERSGAPLHSSSDSSSRPPETNRYAWGRAQPRASPTGPAAWVPQAGNGTAGDRWVGGSHDHSLPGWEDGAANDATVASRHRHRRPPSSPQSSHPSRGVHGATGGRRSSFPPYMSTETYAARKAPLAQTTMHRFVDSASVPSTQWGEEPRTDGAFTPLMPG